MKKAVFIALLSVSLWSGTAGVSHALAVFDHPKQQAVAQDQVSSVPGQTATLQQPEEQIDKDTARAEKELERNTNISLFDTVMLAVATIVATIGLLLFAFQAVVAKQDIKTTLAEIKETKREFDEALNQRRTDIDKELSKIREDIGLKMQILLASVPNRIESVKTEFHRIFR